MRGDSVNKTADKKYFCLIIHIICIFSYKLRTTRYRKTPIEKEFIIIANRINVQFHGNGQQQNYSSNVFKRVRRGKKEQSVGSFGPTSKCKETTTMRNSETRKKQKMRGGKNITKWGWLHRREKNKGKTIAKRRPQKQQTQYNNHHHRRREKEFVFVGGRCRNKESIIT